MPELCVLLGLTMCVYMHESMCVRLSAAPKLVPGFKLHAASLCRRADPHVPFTTVPPPGFQHFVSLLSVWCQKRQWGNPIQTRWTVFFCIYIFFKAVVHPKNEIMFWCAKNSKNKLNQFI